MAIRNKYGDNGSPCLTPLFKLIEMLIDGHSRVFDRHLTEDAGHINTVAGHINKGELCLLIMTQGNQIHHYVISI